MSEFGERLMQGMREAIAIARGELKPPLVTVLYKGYIGTAVYDPDTDSLCGRVVVIARLRHKAK